jgi:hypothetical protein
MAKIGIRDIGRRMYAVRQPFWERGLVYEFAEKLVEEVCKRHCGPYGGWMLQAPLY